MDYLIVVVSIIRYCSALRLCNLIFISINTIILFFAVDFRLIYYLET